MHDASLIASEPPWRLFETPLWVRQLRLRLTRLKWEAAKLASVARAFLGDDPHAVPKDAEGDMHELLDASSRREITASLRYDREGYELTRMPPWRTWLRWLGYVIPYLRHHYRTESTYEQGSYFRAAWRLVNVGRRIRGMPLPVLDVEVDAPCEGCGGRCCTKPADESGFGTVVVERWEHFAKVRPEVLIPSASEPATLYFKFDRLPDRSLRCRFLDARGMCSVHAYRPIACRNFTCTDGLSPHSGRYCGSYFVRQVPTIGRRLVQLGFRALPGSVVAEG